VSGFSRPLQGESTSPNSSPTPDSDRQLFSTGTGFLVNKNFIATADHVLRMNDRGDVCNAVSIMYRHDEYEASIADLDPANDIGLLKLSKPISSTATIRGEPDLRLGETAINYGFPLTGELSTSAKITSGAVNSLAGYNNNSAFIQFDAASQFGNSGGPVLDASGNVIGVVSAKLDDAKNQLVNFATKSTILEGFLKANKVPFEKADLGEKLELPDIAEKAETFTVLVGCWE
jgi:S1-C subfamily serine protease